MNTAHTRRQPSSLFALSPYKSYISRIDFVWKCLVDSVAGRWAVSDQRIVLKIKVNEVIKAKTATQHFGD